MKNKSKNKNSEIDERVMSMIDHGHSWSGIISEKLELDGSAVENSLKRLKSRGMVQFDRAAKKWKRAETSAPSASETEPVVGSGDNTGATASNDRTEKVNTEEIDRKINEARTEATQTGGRRRLSEDEKRQRTEAQMAQREERRRAREARKLEREADRKPAHMSKVERAGERLPDLTESATLLFNEATSNLGRADIAALAAHLQHHNRVEATKMALDQTLSEGDTVRIVGGDPRFIGQTGTVTRAQRIRCYVEVSSDRKPLYLFTSDVERVSQVVEQAAVNG